MNEVFLATAIKFDGEFHFTIIGMSRGSPASWVAQEGDFSPSVLLKIKGGQAVFVIEVFDTQRNKHVLIEGGLK